jgi:hypothetical protein
MTAAVAVIAPDEARTLTDQIKTGVEAVWHLITRAYTERAWSALGYTSWDDYCTREFGTSRLRLPREERAEVVSSLRESGLSLRAIAAATGLGRGTIERELAPVPNGTPAEPEPVAAEPIEEDADVITEGLIIAEQELPPLPENYMNAPGGLTTSTPGQTDRVAEALAKARPEPVAVTGLDGKTYHPQPAAPKEPRRKPITEAFDNANYDLRRVVERVVRLVEDDRFKKNKDQITGSNLSDLIRARDAINGVIQQLEG